MDDSLRERVRRLCDLAGIGREGLSDLCGLTASHLGLVVNGRIVSITDETIRKICSTTGAPIGWLVAGEGDPPAEEDVRRAVATVREQTQGAA